MSPEVWQIASSTDWWASCWPVLVYQSVLFEPLAALLPGPPEPSCSSQVASEQGFQCDLLAVELEVLLLYQAGHQAFLLSPVTEVDLEKAEIARCELLLATVPVHQLVIVVMGVLDLARPFQEEDGVPPVAIDPSWVVGKLADVVSDLKAANPYLRDRELRSLSVDIPFGPDWREQHLHSVTASADQVQVRKDTQASGLGPLLPRGLPPEKYAMCAAALVTGQSMEVALPDDLEWAIRLSAGLVPGVPLKSGKTRLRDFKRLIAPGGVSPLKAQCTCYGFFKLA